MQPVTNKVINNHFLHLLKQVKSQFCTANFVSHVKFALRLAIYNPEILMLRRTVLAFTVLAASSCFASNSPAIEAAKSAASGWLALVDAQDAKSSWQQASSAFKSAVTAAQWSQALDSVRPPLGALRQRESKAAAVETVTVVMDPDGAWKVVGYFIK